MFIKLKTNLAALSTAVILLTGFGSCKKDNSGSAAPDPANATYGLVVMADAKSFVLTAPSLTSGSITTQGAGTAVPEGSALISYKNGYYYYIDADASKLIKYKLDNGKLVSQKAIPLTQISWAYYSSFFNWKDDNTLVLFSSKGGVQFEYATLNVQDMTITASGNINVPNPPQGLYYDGISSVLKDNKLYLTYTLSETWSKPPSDTTYLATIDYPAMNNIKISKDTRFTYPGAYTLYTPNAFTDNGNVYFLTQPALWSTVAPTKPFSFFRVKNGESNIDPDYIYNIGVQGKEEVLTAHYLGNGKALVKVLDKTMLTSTDDYAGKYLVDYYVADVNAKTRVKLNIPRSNYTWSDNVLIENNVAYIGVKSDAAGFSIYTYDISSGTVKKGLTIAGVTSILHIDKLP